MDVLFGSTELDTPGLCSVPLTMAKTSNFVAVAGCIAAAKAANNTGSSLGSHGGFL